MNATILVVDDEPSVRFSLREIFEDRGTVVVEADSGVQALDRLEDVDVVVTDIAMPHMDGLTLLKELRTRAPGLPVIVLTARGSEKIAVEAMKGGAYDYLRKPFDIDEVCAAVARAVEASQLRQRTETLQTEQAVGINITGPSPSFQALLDRTRRVARRDVTVLVRGETGTGKELIATMLHHHSPRCKGPLVRFNCAALPMDLAEAELFGHERGAFTGADRARPGYFEQADGGTLVLDEVGELSTSLQPKLLRVLQSGEIQPLGARRPHPVDVRVVSCTHRDLSAEMAAGRFREDLYYRLAVVELGVPPLRERREDISALAETLRRKHAVRFELDDVPFPAELLSAFEAHDWPGNVRELENAVVRLLALSDTGAVPAAAWRPSSRSVPTAAPDASRPETLRTALQAAERALIARALEEEQGNHSATARRLGVTRTTLLDKLKRLGLR